MFRVEGTYQVISRTPTEVCSKCLMACSTSRSTVAGIPRANEPHVAKDRIWLSGARHGMICRTALVSPPSSLTNMNPPSERRAAERREGYVPWQIYHNGVRRGRGGREEKEAVGCAAQGNRQNQGPATKARHRPRCSQARIGRLPTAEALEFGEGRTEPGGTLPPALACDRNPLNFAFRADKSLPNGKSRPKADRIQG
jgi:hypothetical protein